MGLKRKVIRQRSIMICKWLVKPRKGLIFPPYISVVMLVSEAIKIKFVCERSQIN